MATNFYKSGGSYFTADTNQKILNLADLQTYAKAGGKEITAPAAPTGSTAIPNPAAIPNYNVTANIGGTLYGTPKTTITPNSLQPASPLNIPTGGSEVDTSKIMAEGAKASQKSIQDYISELTVAPTEAENQQSDFLKEIANLTAQFSNKGADQLTAEQAQNLPQLKSDLSAINSQITTKLAEYEALNTTIENKPIGMGEIRKMQQQANKQKASEIGLLQARALGLQGQVQAAQDTANRAIDLKYSTIEAQINVYEAQLKAIEPILNKEEKIRAEARQKMIEDQKLAIAEEKEKEKEIQGIMLDASQNGASNDILDKINNSETVEDAIKISGQFNSQIISQDLDDKMALNGYQYVNTPALRDQLKKEGYEIIQQGGRTYARRPDPIELNQGNSLVDPVTGKVIAYNPKTYKGTGGGGGGSGGGGGGSPATRTFTIKEATNAMISELNNVKGSDGYISPEDYKKARLAWQDAGLNATDFDTKFKGYRNPQNPYYFTTGEEENAKLEKGVYETNKKYLMDKKQEGYTKQEFIDAGYDINLINDVFGKEPPKEEPKKAWWQFWK